MPDSLDANAQPMMGKRSGLRAFWDYFVLFSGISTAANLSRTQPRPVRPLGFFLFRGVRRTKVNAKSSAD